MTVSSIFRNLLRLRKIPRFIQRLLFKRVIVVYQMGRVSSRAVQYAIQESLKNQDEGTILFHNHRVSNRSMILCLWRARLGLPLKIICPIREPIARDVSAFFLLYVERRIHLFANTDLGELKELFLSDSHRGDNLAKRQFGLDWFDRQFRPLTRIDVYKEPFPIDRKWQIYRRGFIRVLLYRIDLKRSEQAKLISSFLGIQLGEIKPRNQGKGKVYAELYSRFRESVKLPEQYIGRMHNSRFAQHFWSPQELKAAADKWRASE